MYMESADAQKLADHVGEIRLTLVSRLCECTTPQNAMCLCTCCSVDAPGFQDT